MAIVEKTPARTFVRQWLPLSLMFLTVGLSTAMAYPFLTLFLNSAVRADPVEITLYLILSPLSSVIVSSRLGHLSDRRPIRRRLLLIAAVAGCGGATLMAFVRDYWVLLGGTVTLMAAAGAMLPQIFAYARAVLGETDRATVAISRLRTLFSFAWVGGPPVASVLLAAGGFRLVYSAAAAMYALSALVVWLQLDRSGDAPLAPPDDAPPVVRRPNAPRRVIWMTLAAFAILQCATNVSIQALSLFIGHDLGGDVRDAGLILGLCAGLEIPLMLGLGALSIRMPLRRLLLAGALCEVAYMALASSASVTWQLAVGQLLNASAVAAIQGLGVSYIQDMLPGQPGRASTLYTNTFPAGAVLVGPIVGVAAHFGYRWAYVAGVALAVIGFALLLAGRPARTRSEVG